MTLPGTLASRSVLVTRPAQQAAPLCELIRAAGGKAWPLPMLEIVPAPDARALREALAEAVRCDAVIFTSVNALEQALLAGGARWPQRVYCVGAATAAAVRRAELPPPVSPQDDFSSEGLLALPELAQIRGQRFLLVTGEGGRGVLADGLCARGAQVVRANVYSRRPVRHAEAAVRSALTQSDSAVLTSGETLERLIAATPPDLQAVLVRLPLVVPSQRVLQMARARGFAAAISVPQPLSDAGIVAALAGLHASRRIDPSDP